MYVLCIGGPFDGERLDMKKIAPTVTLSRKKGKIDKIKNPGFVYVRHILQDHHGKYVYFVHRQIPAINAVAALLGGYQPGAPDQLSAEAAVHAAMADYERTSNGETIN